MVACVEEVCEIGSGCSELSGAKDSKAVLSCEWPEERSAFACLFAARKR